VPSSWDFENRLTVGEIQRRGGARLGFVGNGGCGGKYRGKEVAGGCLKEGARDPGRACPA